MADDPCCWYCGRPAQVWCDAVLGFAQAIPPIAAPQQLLLVAVAEPPRSKPRAEQRSQPVTCDAAACSLCARRFGWRTVGRLMVCQRGGRGGGCKAETIDRCHLHAPSTAPLHFDQKQIARARESLREACRAMEQQRRRSDQQKAVFDG